MVKTIGVLWLAAAVATPLSAFAQSGYGTEGPNGRRLHSHAQSTFERHWNACLLYTSDAADD